VREQQEKRPCGWSCRPLKIEQLPRRAGLLDVLAELLFRDYARGRVGASEWPRDLGVFQPRVSAFEIPFPGNGDLGSKRLGSKVSAFTATILQFLQVLRVRSHREQQAGCAF
jgi:hypothetical protein